MPPLCEGRGATLWVPCGFPMFSTGSCHYQRSLGPYGNSPARTPGSIVPLNVVSPYGLMATAWPRYWR